MRRARAARSSAVNDAMNPRVCRIAALRPRAPASVPNGTSSVTWPSCRPPARWCCSIAPGTTAPASSASWFFARRGVPGFLRAAAFRGDAAALDISSSVLVLRLRRGAGAPLPRPSVGPTNTEAQPDGPGGPQAMGPIPGQDVMFRAHGHEAIPVGRRGGQQAAARLNTISTCSPASLRVRADATTPAA